MAAPVTYEEAVADAYCPCHGEPWSYDGAERRCVVKKRAKQKRWADRNRDRMRREGRERYAADPWYALRQMQNARDNEARRREQHGISTHA